MSTSVQRARRREQRENTRREILAATDRFLRRRPFRELSVEEVMAETGLTRTAFYRHFDDVTDLVLRLIEDVGGELYAVAERWLEGASEGFEGAAHDALGGIVGFFSRHGPIVRAIAEAASTDERVEQGYRGFIERFIDLTASGFDGLIERGQIEPFETRSLARALNLMNESYLLDQFGREPGADPEVVIATLARVWVRTVGPVSPPRARTP